MKWNNVSLLLLLALLISACDSQQPTYSASNANSAPPPPPPAAQPPPPPPVAEPKPVPVAETRPAPKPPVVAVAQHTPSASLPERGEALAPVNPIGIGSCDSYIERYRTCVNNGVASFPWCTPSIGRCASGRLTSLQATLRSWSPRAPRQTSRRVMNWSRLAAGRSDSTRNGRAVPQKRCAAFRASPVPRSESGRAARSR